MIRIGLIAAAGLASGAWGQHVANWVWVVEDTAGNVGFVAEGESAVLLLYAEFDPPQPQEGGGLAGAPSYDILGNEGWERGTIDEFNNYLYTVYAGDIQPNNDIYGVNSYQLPLLFNPDFDPANPIDLLLIRWTPDSYEGQIVTLDHGTPPLGVYIDIYGTTIPYETYGGPVSFGVAPSPGMIPVAAMTVCAATRRRRPGWT